MEKIYQIRTRDFLPAMYEALDKCGIPREHFSIEADLSKYLRTSRSNPIALTLHGDADRELEPRIIFRETFTSPEADSVRSRIGVFDLELHDMAKRLNTDKKLILHTLLHEAEHYGGLPQGEEDEADRRAMKRMGEWGWL